MKGASHPPRVIDCIFGNAARTLLNPELKQSRETGNGQKSKRRPDPTDVASAAGIGDDSTDDGNASAHGSDHVANPVHEVQERTFGLRPGLTLDRDVRLRRGARF